ncbi:MAG: alpha/beta fold hydrolase [Gemmataceae bacterium]
MLLCPPTGHEKVHSHRALRHLADALANAGFPTLRLDYFGTGDSAGGDDSPRLVAAQLSSVADARGWLRRELGCQKVTLVGLRLGALLAGISASEEPVDGLVLWAPVTRGRSFVREMKALSLAAEGPPPAAGEIEPAGFVLTDETAADLSALDLLKASPRSRRVLVLGREDMPPEPALAKHLRALGAEVAEVAAPGYARMMAEPHYTEVPHEAIARVVEWMGTAVQGREEAGDSWPVEAVLPGTGLRKKAASFGPDGGLFGIVTQPREDPPPGWPFVVLLNAGAANHVGPNRLHVLAARSLAQRGFCCLRLDLCGLGDSDAPDPARENHTYPETMFRDIDLALHHVQQQHGTERVVLMGLCSGAYAAFQAAAHLRCPALVECVVINPLTFYWKEGMLLDRSPAHRLQRDRAILRAIFRPDKWLKLLTGQASLGLFEAVRAVFGRLGGGGKAETPDLDILAGHPQKEDLPADLRRIAQAGRHLSFFFSRSDPGYDLLETGAGKEMENLCRAGKAEVHFIEDADHTFSRRAAREAFLSALAAHLCRRYPA